jgi:hypothetical protein
MDSPIEFVWHEPSPEAVVLFDGIFLHRPELVDAWDLSVFLLREVNPAGHADIVIVSSR